MSSTTTGEQRVELYLSAEPQFGVEEQKQAVIDRLTALDRADRIAGFETYIWGREFRPTGPLEGTDYHRTVLDSVRAFEEWLQQNGASADHLFDRREVDSEITDDAYTVISLPTMCLAVYADGRLDGIYPYYDGEETHTVRDGLSELETAESDVSADGVVPEKPRQ